MKDVSDTTVQKQYIELKMQPAKDASKNPDLYLLSVHKDPDHVIISSGSQTGFFYGIQSLLSLANNPDRSIPTGTVYDYPRFSYRGMHLDVARNFRTKEDVKQLLEVMSWYKMNKLHLHLTDDEGWRIEIDGLPELTQVSTMLCYDTTNIYIYSNTDKYM